MPEQTSPTAPDQREQVKEILGDYGVPGFALDRCWAALAPHLSTPTAPTEVTFAVGKDWPTPNHCRRAAAGLDTIGPARYGDILRAYADAEDARIAQHGPVTATRRNQHPQDKPDA